MPKVPSWVFILLAVLYLSATRLDTMDVDASQYAEISREMMVSGDYLHVYDRGIDYLDKPPLLFWLSATSMKLFGVNNFGYKLPSILFALLALFATYKLGKHLYDDATGRMAALILGTCQGMFLMTNDVRCDTILLGCVITAIWLIQEWIVNNKLWYLMGGSTAIAFGMMAKGPVALMVPVFCFISDWLLKRQWKNFLRPQYILALIVIAALLLPMSIGLYQQFDVHPEKLVNGKTGVSGLRFFYWSQSFGRITGESPWQNAVYFTFLFENMLWSFLPWIILFVVGLIVNSVTLIRQKFRLQPQQEWLTTGGFLLTYVSMASSAYQLPHYIFVAFPLAALFVAKLLHDMFNGSYQLLFSIMRPLHLVISFLLLVVLLSLIAYVFPAGAVVISLWLACFVGWLYLVITKKLHGKLLWLPAIAMFIVNIFLTNHFYYTLQNYQVGSQVGKHIHNNNINPSDVIIYNMEDPLNCIQFYAQGTINSTDTVVGIPGKKYVLTMENGLKNLAQAGYKYTIDKSGEFYKISELTPAFLNPHTRSTATKKYYFVKLQ